MVVIKPVDCSDFCDWPNTLYATVTQHSPDCSIQIRYHATHADIGQRLSIAKYEDSLPGRIEELSRTYPPLNDRKSQRRVNTIERIAAFYEGKIPVVDEKASSMFRDFIGALKYAVTAIKMYRKVCEEINQLAQEANGGKDRV